MLSGYTVNKQDDLSDAERARRLKCMIDRGILEKHVVIQYLEMFINTNGAAQNMTDAVLKWRNDLAFVQSYKLDKQRRIKIARIK